MLLLSLRFRLYAAPNDKDYSKHNTNWGDEGVFVVNSGFLRELLSWGLYFLC